jgi:hypothetical protein
MVADIVGLPSLRIGLKTYLKTYRYGNADTQDLWECLGAYSPLGIEGLKVVNLFSINKNNRCSVFFFPTDTF